MRTIPVAVPAPGLPLADPTDRATYTARKLEHLRWERYDLAPGALALAQAALDNAQDAYASATEAAASKAATAASEANIAALANFKGTWASLAALPLAPSRVLAKPASVSHNGAFWALLNDLADVATSQPGVSADWQVVGGAWPIVPINTNTTAQPWKTYVFTGACTLTAPAISGNGKQFGIDVLPGVTGAIFAPAGADKTRGVAGAQPIEAPFKAILTDSGATYGWI